MPQTLHTLCSDGARALPLKERPVVVTLDNCALSMMLSEPELRKCSQARHFREYLRTKPPNSLVLNVGAAVLEGALLDMNCPLNDILIKKTDLISELVGYSCSQESLLEFAEGVGVTLSQHLALFFMLVKANRIFIGYQGKGPDEDWRAKQRVREFSTWVRGLKYGVNLGAQSGAILPIYCALAHNVQARTEFGVATVDSFPKLLNGAWDLLHLYHAMTALPVKCFSGYPEGGIPISLFATSDQGLANVFSGYKHFEQGLVGFEPKGLLENRKLRDEVFSLIQQRWPRLKSPHEYAIQLSALAGEMVQITEGSGVTEMLALRARYLETAELLKGRIHFSLN